MRIIEILEDFNCPDLLNPAYLQWLQAVNTQPDLEVIYLPLKLRETAGGIGQRINNDYLLTTALQQRSNGLGMFWSEQNPIVLPDISSLWVNKVSYKIVGTDLQITCAISHPSGCSAGNKLVLALVDTSDQFKNWIRKYLKSDWVDASNNWAEWIDIPALKPNEVFNFSFTEPIEKTLNGFTFSDQFKLLSIIQDFSKVNDPGLPNQPETQHWYPDREIFDVTEATDITNVVPVQPPVVNPVVPQNVHASVGAKFVAITWTPVAGLKYRVRYKVKVTTAWKLVAAGSAQKLIGVSELHVGTTYEVQVEAIGTTSASKWSAVQTFTTK